MLLLTLRGRPVANVQAVETQSAATYPPERSLSGYSIRVDRVLGMLYFVGHPGERNTYPSLCLKPKNFRSVGTYSESFPDAFVGTKT
jgi:hypothetical protein